MGNYLYNGIEAGALPNWNKDKHPHAVMVLYDYNILSSVDKLVVFFLSEVKTANDLWYTIGDECATATRPVDSTGAFSAFGAIETLNEEKKISPENVVWSNTDIYNEDGTLYLAASDPVPVSPVKLNPALLVQSFFTGQALRRSRK